MRGEGARGEEGRGERKREKGEGERKGERGDGNRKDGRLGFKPKSPLYGYVFSGTT